MVKSKSAAPVATSAAPKRVQPRIQRAAPGKRREPNQPAASPVINDEIAALKQLKALRKVYNTATLVEVVQFAHKLMTTFGRGPTDSDHFVVISFDSKKRLRRLAQSKAKEVRNWNNTDAALLHEAAALSSRSEADFAHAAVLATAKATLSSAARLAQARDLPSAKRCGRANINHDRLKAAYDVMAQSGKRVTYSTLAKQAGLLGGHLQAKRFMERAGYREGVASNNPPTHSGVKGTSPKAMH